MTAAAPVHVRLRSALVARGITDAEIRSAVGRGDLIRLARGSYVDQTAFADLDLMDQQRATDRRGRGPLPEVGDQSCLGRVVARAAGARAA